MTLDNENLIFDIDNSFNVFDLTAKQFDTNSARSFTFQLIHNGSPFCLDGTSVQVGGIKADGKKIFNDVQIVDSVNGIIELDLTSQMLAVDGVLKLEFIFIKGNVRLSSYPFEIRIIPSVTNFNAIESSDEFGALTNALNSVEGTINNLTTKVNDAITNVTANQIGGTNILTGTQFFDYGWTLSENGVDAKIDRTNLFQGCAVEVLWYNWNYFYQDVCYEIGTTYTISCYAKADKQGANIYFSLADNMQAWGEKSLTTEWKKYVFTFTPSLGTGSLRIECSGLSDTNKAYVSKIKLEKGSMATDWSPNPLDYERQIGGSNLLLNTGLDNKIDIIEQTGNINFAIFSNHNNAQAVYNNKFLFLDNKDPFGDAYTTLFKTEDFSLIPNSMYTVSFIYKCDFTGNTPSTSSYVRLILTDDSIRWLQINDFDFVKGKLDWQKSAFTFEVPSNIKRVELRLGFNTDKYGWFAVNGIKLEKGLTATNWCPHYNDWRKQIGATNLITNSLWQGVVKGTKTIPYWDNWGDIEVYCNTGTDGYNKFATLYLQSIQGGGIYQNLSNSPISIGDTCTFSCLLEPESNVTGHSIRIEFYDENWKTLDVIAINDESIEGAKRIVKTFTATVDSANQRLVIEHKGSRSSQTCYLLKIGEMKLEKGYASTDWNLSPYDVLNIQNSVNTNTQQIASNSSSINDLYGWVNRNIGMQYISGATSLTLQPNWSYYLDGQHVADITHIDHSAIPAGGKVYFYVASGDPLAHIVFRRQGLCNQDVRVWLPCGQDFWIRGNENGDKIFTMMKIGDAMRFLS